ncbi:MAG: PilZ domain-containing protein [Acidobacteria bacterium]|nr:PilZ domain-containing protein [Acidobacteriota bacterium]
MIFFKKKKEQSHSPEDVVQGDEVLAYLDEVIRQKVNIDLFGSSGRYESTLVTLDEKGMRARLLGTLPSQARDVSKGGFALDRMYWMFATQIVNDGGKLFIQIPNTIIRKDRRRCARTNFTRREEVKVTILQGLGSGIGVLGTAINVSENGMQVFVKNAMNLSDEKPIQPHPGLFPPGTDLMLIRIHGIPGMGQVEVSGKVVRMSRDGGVKLVVGFKMEGHHAQILGKFIDGRQMEFRRTRRQRRKPEDGAELMSGGEWSPGPDDEESRSPEPSGPSLEASNEEMPERAESKPQSKQAIMVLGSDMERWIRFELETDAYQWIFPVSLESAIHEIQSARPTWIFFQPDFHNVDGLDFMVQLRSTGILNTCRLALCGLQLSVKDKVRGRLVQADRYIDIEGLLPEDILEVLES